MLFNLVLVVFLLAVIHTRLWAESAQDLQVRLLTPLASYSHTGKRFRAIVVGTLSGREESTLPIGTIIRGSVKSAKALGLGIRRERTSLELTFDGCESPSGELIPCEVRLLAVDNARETVSKPNQIQGILAASHLHSWFGGVWYRPAPALFRRSTIGLTGAGRMIYSRVAPCPIGAVAVVALRLTLFRLPNPEIELPSGTDLTVRATWGRPAEHSIEPRGRADNHLTEFSAQPAAEDPLPVDITDLLRSAPSVITRSDQTVETDRINVALLGSREQIIGAFHAAGWSQAEPFNRSTFRRSYKAYASMTTYPTAPVSPLLYDGRLPDLVFQQSFNSIAKRHHVRIWALAGTGESVWVGAATHDISIALDLDRMSLTHRIDVRIDRERSKVMNDLAFIRCVGRRQTIERAEPLDAGEARPAITDGALVAAELQDCGERPAVTNELAVPRRSVGRKIARRLILETRHYLTRGNAYYWAYRGARWGFSARRTPPEEQ